MSAQLPIGVLAGEVPLDGGAIGVAAFLPGVDLTGDGAQVRHPSIHALTREHADLNLGHVQPAGMLRGVVKLDPAQQARRRGGRAPLQSNCGSEYSNCP